jgi:hypothetical protein
MSLTSITTVTTAADSYDLTTLDTVKDELSITDGKNDATLKRYLSWASAAVSKECNRVFAAETVQDQIWPGREMIPLSSGFKVLQLSRWPVISIISFTEGETTLVKDTDFVVDPDPGHLLRLGSGGCLMCWNATPKVVQYQAGFTEIPWRPAGCSDADGSQPFPGQRPR